MFKNVAGQKLVIYAHDTIGDDAATGDAANITGSYSLDGGVRFAITDTNPTELDSTNMPGIYIFDLSQAETNGNMITFYAKSTTAGIRIEPIVIFTMPADFTSLTTAGIITAMKAMTGITEGGTWTWEKILKIMAAFAAGDWRKSADGTKQELMDAEDGTTVILEQLLTRSPSPSSNYRDITVKI